MSTGVPLGTSDDLEVTDPSVPAAGVQDGKASPAERPVEPRAPGAPTATIFLCGDVMTGRGIDQILPHPAPPQLHEPFVGTATGYVDLAERAHGRIPRPVNFAYPWGAALEEWSEQRPVARVVNLETAVTTRDDAAVDKDIHYRMSPRNVACLQAAGFDVCVLANNHVLDWGRAGLLETLDTLHAAGIHTVGAGRDAGEAGHPAIKELPGGGRLLVFAYGLASSGVPGTWAATADRPGVNLLDGLSAAEVAAVGRNVSAYRRAEDIVVLSLHWGGNWGYRVSADERTFARAVIDDAGVDLVHGHSSHHVKGIEVYRDRLILYGCGDWLNDYEGISGYEEFRGDLSLMYFPTIEVRTGRLRQLRMRTTRTRRFRITPATASDSAWLEATLNREGRALGTRVERDGEQHLALHWL